MTTTTLVIPCYNEASRLDEAALLSLADDDDGAHLLFVDDGSTDGTGDRLRALKTRRPEQVKVLTLEQNQGKAEAVRRGLLGAMAGGDPIVGYVDADLATPPVEIRRLLRIMRTGPAAVLLASRVSLLGRSIERSPARHYLGRVFASAASFILKLNVYDTQCGAKFFRNGPALAAAVATPFLSRWAFDIELLGRLVIGGPDVAPVDLDRIVEEPLLIWRDVGGSKLGPAHMAKAALDVARIGRDLAQRRTRRG